ncbi:conserved hypothetical protein [Candidatus Sulfopaludibacter sp. SbA6]|nr:conserved hypothetical protein [Candidatus Sulfopaludibacter sp. SbA6]
MGEFLDNPIIPGYNYLYPGIFNMDKDRQTLCTAFEGARRIASGDLKEVALKAKKALDRGAQAAVLIFDDISSELIEVDFRGTAADVAKRLAPVTPEVEEPRGPGRPRLGVVAREVTLLPRHWDWLNSQPGGASVALRKLVEEARRTYAGRDRIRRAQESAYRFMSAMAGNEPGFEEATRALFAGNPKRFDEMSGKWPKDIADHAKNLASAAF